MRAQSLKLKRWDQAINLGAISSKPSSHTKQTNMEDAKRASAVKKIQVQASESELGKTKLAKGLIRDDKTLVSLHIKL
jgi:hypothetical protein